MAPSTIARKSACLGLAAAATALGVVACLGGGCSSSSAAPPAPSMFEVYAPGVDASAIPLCTSDESACTEGVSALSSAATSVCTALCMGSPNGATPCCVSTWEPSTVLCPPTVCTP